MFFLLLCIHVASAFLHTLPASSLNARSMTLDIVTRRPSRGARLTMCSPVPTPVDPALASALVHLVVDKALGDLERLGLGPPRGGSVRVEYSGETVVPDRRSPLASLGRRGVRRMLNRLKVATSGTSGSEAVKGTHTMLRTRAHEAVRLARGWPQAAFSSLLCC
jgi:hypothetical protein